MQANKQINKKSMYIKTNKSSKAESSLLAVTAPTGLRMISHRIDHTAAVNLSLVWLS